MYAVPGKLGEGIVESTGAMEWSEGNQKRCLRDRLSQSLKIGFANQKCQYWVRDQYCHLRAPERPEHMGTWGPESVGTWGPGRTGC